jgi:nucleoside 2-deoxyribosyltransferase
MLDIVGGVYRERCMRPSWDEFFGSAGRAASAISKLRCEVTLHSYLSSDASSVMDAKASAEGFRLIKATVPKDVSFFYEHGLARPHIWQQRDQFPPLHIQAEKVLRYGMMESTAIVEADWAVFDPQNVDGPESFHRNGSVAKHLALVLNRYEARALLGATRGISLDEVAEKLAAQEKAEVVIIKRGPQGALVWHDGRIDTVPAYETQRVWKIGSGDQFAANFAYSWMVEKRNPVDAALRASRATAFYCQHAGFPTLEMLDVYSPNAIVVSESFAAGLPRKVYLAGPFFTLGQLWVVEQARRCLMDMGLHVFSPYHDVGPGEASIVVPKDIDGIHNCDLVFAIVDGMDPGTVFEVGYAQRDGKPVIVYAENESAEDCKMMIGTGCFMRDDFVSAVYQTVWVAASL